MARPKHEGHRRSEWAANVSDDEAEEAFFDYDPTQLRIDLVRNGLQEADAEQLEVKMAWLKRDDRIASLSAH